MRLHPHRSSLRGARGTVLIVALLVMAFIAFVLGGYLRLNLTASRLADRSYFANAALNLAEAGAEEGLWSFNQAVAGAESPWAGWNQDGAAAWREFGGFALSPTITGSVKVYLDDRNPGSTSHPRIVTLASVGPAEGDGVTKMVEITLRRRSLFAGGLVARERVTLRGGNPSVDSWDSDPDRDPATPAVPYDPAVRRDGGSVASASFAADAAEINHGDVWGTVATGGAAPVVATDGLIHGSDTPAGVTIDPARVSTDFSAHLPIFAAPADGTPIPAITTSLTLGTAGTATRWRCPEIALAGNETLTVQGDVTIVLTAWAGRTAIAITGRAAIVIPAGSSLTLYAEGDVLAAGRGFVNNNPTPASCVLWGTGTDPAVAQDLRVTGNGALRMAIYAPNGAVTINGNGDVMGAIVADTITLTGNAAFHYDEALGRYGASTPFGIARWRELTTPDARRPYEALFTGW